MEFVKARVVCACTQCRLAIAEDCIKFGLELPKQETCEIPVKWVGRICPHTANGLAVELLDSSTGFGTVKTGESMRWKPAEEFELPAWRNNLDFTKNWGFPCREDGRYGSHPSHDPFDDESNP